MAVACPCCGFLTLSRRSRYVICKVCFWEDDGQDDPRADEVWGGSNAGLSLTAAREHYRTFGATERRMLPFVRPPEPHEVPD